MLLLALFMISLWLPINIDCKENACQGVDLNRPDFKYKAHIPPIPSQSKEYLNIANYNMRCSRCDLDTPNSWEKRKRYFFDAVYLEDEAQSLMQQMQRDLKDSLAKYIASADVRDASVMGHYGEPGSWGGFEDDLYACKVKGGDFECNTLDVCFTNAKESLILLSYAINGAYDPGANRPYNIDESIKDDYCLASDHFMIECYLLI